MSAPTAEDSKRWPNLFIVGEPRSGTTSLHEILSKHPEIYMSPVKEPHYYSSIEFPAIEVAVHRVTHDPATYARLFAGATEPIRGESSTYYLADPEAPKRIKADVPRAKIIAVLRDPVERAYSHYLLHNRRGKQELSFYEMVKHDVEQGEKQDLFHDLVELGRYHKHLSHYSEYFGDDQMLVVLFDDLVRRPEAALKRIYTFLGVDASEANLVDVSESRNVYTRPRSGLVDVLLSNRLLMRIGLAILPRSVLRFVRNRLLLKVDQKPEMDPAARALLQDVYAPEITQLERLLGLDLDSLRRTWDKPVGGRT